MHSFGRGVVIVLMVTASVCAAQDRSYGRSVVASPYGIVATSEVQASQAGARMLERGGSAIDAAIAANAVLNVMEPMMNGMGGDLFAIYWEAKTGKLYGLNASGWAPKALTPEHLKAKGMTAMPPAGIDSVTVPGRGGWLGEAARPLWQAAVARAVSTGDWFAEQGFPVTEIMDETGRSSPRR